MNEDRDTWQNMWVLQFLSETQILWRSSLKGFVCYFIHQFLHCSQLVSLEWVPTSDSLSWSAVTENSVTARFSVWRRLKRERRFLMQELSDWWTLKICDRAGGDVDDWNYWPYHFKSSSVVPCCHRVSVHTYIQHYGNFVITCNYFTMKVVTAATVKLP